MSTYLRTPPIRRGPDAELPSWGGSEPSGEGFWDKASEKAREDRRRRRAPVEPGRPRRRGRRLLWTGAGVVGVLMLLVGLAPAIAGRFVPGVVRERAGRHIAGQVRVASVSLSWLGSQSLGHIELTDDGKTIADLSIDLDQGLLGLATGSRRLGTATVRGKVDLVRFADGTTNLERALAAPKGAAAAPAPGGASPARVPEGAAVRVLLDSLSITFRDESVAGGPLEAALRKIDAEAALAAGDPVTLKLKAEATSRVGAGAAQCGSITIDALVDKWMGSDGALTPERVNVKTAVVVKDLPTALVDALMGRGGALAAGLGERVQLSVVAEGSTKSGQATVRASAGGADPSLSAEIAASLADGVLSLSSPASLSVKGSALRALAPRIDAALAGQDALSLDALPDVRVTVAELRVRVPGDGKPLDLRRTRFEGEATTGEVAGRVRLEDSGSPRALRLAPLAVKVSASDLAGPVRVTASTSARVADTAGALASAGTIDADFTLSGLLDAAGAPVAGIPGGVNGRAAVKGVATALAQPFVAATGLDLPRDVGPTLDLDLRAETKGGGGADLPPVDLTLVVTAEQVNAYGALTLLPDRVETRGEGLRATLMRGGAIAGRFLGPGTGLALDPAGRFNLAVTDVAIPLSPKRAPVLDRASARASVHGAGLTLRGSGVADAPLALTTPVAIASVEAGAALAPGKAPTATLSLRGSHAGQPFTIDGSAEIAGVLKPTPAGQEPAPPALADAAPVGRLEIRGLPTSLLGAVAAIAPPAGAARASDSYRAGEGLDLPALLRDALGPTLDLVASGQQAGERVALDARAEARGLTAQVKGSADERTLSIEPSRTRLTLDPLVAERLLKTFTDPNGPRPALAEATGVVIDVGAVVIPRSALTDRALLPTVTLAMGFDRHLVVHGLEVGQGPQRRDLGPLGVAGFSLKVEAPLGALGGGGSGTLKALVSGDAVSGTRLQRVASFNGEVALPLTGGPAMAGPLSGKVNLVRIDSAAADPLLAAAVALTPSDPRLTELLGAGADASVVLTIDPPTGAMPLGEQLASGRLRVEASLASPNLSTTTPARLTLLPDRIVLGEPLAVAAMLTPGVLDRLVGASGDPEARLRLAAPAPATLRVDRLAIARATPEQAKAGAEVGPLKPGVFDLALSADVPSVQLAAGAQQMSLAGTRVLVASEAGGGSITAALDVAEAVVRSAPGAAPQSARGMTLRATIDGVADAEGNVAADRAVLNAQGDLPIVPTALVDALAGQGGLLVDALGATVAVSLRAEALAVGAGTGALTAEVRSERASATVRGRLTPGLFVMDQAPADVRVTRITPDLSRRLTKGVPIIASLEKSPDLPPATVLGRDLRVPTDGNLSNLNGDVEIDPGTVRFSTSPLFSRVLSKTNQRSEGAAGERLQPLKIEARQGVLRLSRWELPLGEYKVLTEGSVNLVTQDVDVITWIPLSALSEDAARVFQTTDVLGGLLGRNKEEDETRKRQIAAPFRSRGKMGSLGPPTPDLKLFAEEVGRTFKDELRNAPRRLLEGLRKDSKPPGGG
ncbi:MAG: hypothetical protein FJ255_12320 [Phycisphaerae bacterium]|nr:hypothetical protein [Phycisphaerae bacterium]